MGEFPYSSFNSIKKWIFKYLSLMYLPEQLLKRKRCPKEQSGGFSLIEVMIVVTILGIFISLVIPGYEMTRQTAQNSRLMADWRTFSTAYKQYALEVGDFPDDANPGTIPNGMEEFLRNSQWTEGAFVGGNWDWDYDKFGITAGVSLVNSNLSPAQMLKLDEKLDDGDLGTGDLQLIAANRYSLIIEF